MAEIKQFICDVCGAVKGETNHWWMLSMTEKTCLRLTPWLPGAIGSPALHLCGERCVIVKVSEFMGAK